jgi:DNA-binding beta-propeller fold protein YncE
MSEHRRSALSPRRTASPRVGAVHVLAFLAVLLLPRGADALLASAWVGASGAASTGAPMPAVGPGAPASTAAPHGFAPPVMVREWGSKGIAPGRFLKPTGIAVDSAGAVYVVDFSLGRVQKFSGVGRLLDRWGSPDPESGFDMPFGVAVGPDDSVYVTELGRDGVKRLDGQGRELTRWGAEGHGRGEFDEPRGVAVDRRGDVYVVDELNHRVQKFTADGRFLTSWGGFGPGHGRFRCPVGIAVDPRGFVYVTDPGNGLVQRFTASGAFVGQWAITPPEGTGWFWPYGVAVDPRGYVMVTDPGTSDVLCFTGEGKPVSGWSRGRGAPAPPPAVLENRTVELPVPEAPGRGRQNLPVFHTPVGIAYAPSGDAYVLDQGIDSVKRFRF